MVGCKSTKSVATSGELNTAITSKELIKNHKKQAAKFKTLQAKVRVEYIQGEQSQTHTISLRMQRDETIWISSTLGIVRALITPEKVGFYNKLDDTYFDGDFTLISNLLGTKLNFENVQSMLLGEALFNLNDKTYNTDTHEGSYVLFPSNQDALYELFLLLNPTHFKMDSQQLSQTIEQRMLQVDYMNYQEVGKQILPENMKIFAIDNGVETIISMEMKSITLNKDLRFPFRIPSGFDEIVLE
jgi:outer membrane biogenesis lipoprotein LolB